MKKIKPKTLEQLIYTYSDFLKKRFGRKVFRVGLSIGEVCPHRLKTGGCIFCNPETFTGVYQAQNLSVKEQLAEAIPQIKNNCGDVALLAYFQDETSTAGDLHKLREKYSATLDHPDMVGLVVSTRSDYINKEIIDLLKSLPTPVTVEIGLQSIHNRSLNLLNRGHTFEQVDEAIMLCGEAGLEVGVHLILGIPEETEDDILETIRYVSENKYITQVKFHNLVCYQKTMLAQMVKINNWKILTIEEYIPLLANAIAHLRQDMVISRLFTSNIKRNQIAIGEYKGNKTKWMAQLRNYMNAYKIWQGSKMEAKNDTTDASS
jgi:radical SAM protein (TIGR01212 family)